MLISQNDKDKLPLSLAIAKLLLTLIAFIFIYQRFLLYGQHHQKASMTLPCIGDDTAVVHLDDLGDQR